MKVGGHEFKNIEHACDYYRVSVGDVNRLRKQHGLSIAGAINYIYGFEMIPNTRKSRKVSIY